MMPDPKTLFDLIGEVGKTVKKITPYIKNMSSSARLMEEEYEGIAALGTEQISECAQLLTTSYEYLSRKLAALKTKLFLTYWAIASMRDPIEELMYPESSDDQLLHDLFCCFDVSSVVIGDRLAVKLPLLWGRYHHSVRMGGRTVTRDDLKWMVLELDCSLSKISDGLPSYLQRNISYVHVIPKGKTPLVDNDNYDTKSITDTITNHLVGTDGPMTCSFSFYSLREGTLPAGTYVVVSPSFDMPPSLASLVTTLEAVFSVRESDI